MVNHEYSQIRFSFRSRSSSVENNADEILINISFATNPAFSVDPGCEIWLRPPQATSEGMPLVIIAQRPA
ncbi:hypothetical protein PanWU01x14_254000 [Parasponia andersonii]|uniref:Uncharacterized protein n=1 Tax=Parasponia andersonii TaxID=3476 RepID=A0A2P5BBD8_PARAD|nr:hypothetical protein PanWU01x14_254000 [Parasponia andersonii]